MGVGIQREGGVGVAQDIGLSAACISCARLLAAQTYTTVRRKQLLKLLRKIAAGTLRFSHYFEIWGTRGAGSQVSYIPNQFLLLFASMLRGLFIAMAALGNSWCHCK